MTLLARLPGPTLLPSTFLDPGDTLFAPTAFDGPAITLRFSLLVDGTPAWDVARPRRFELEAVLDVRSPGTDVELDVTRLIPGLVPAVLDAPVSGRLPAGPVVETMDILEPGRLPGAGFPTVLRTVVEPIALIGLRMVEGGLACGTKGAVPEAPPETVRVVPIRLVPFATLFTP